MINNRVRIFSAKEDVSGTQTVEDAVNELKNMTSVLQMDEYCQKKGIKVLSRECFPYSRVIFPLNKDNVAYCTVGMDSRNYDVVPICAGVANLMGSSYFNTYYSAYQDAKRTKVCFPPDMTTDEVIGALENADYQPAEALANACRGFGDSAIIIEQLAHDFSDSMIQKINIGGLQHYEVEMAFADIHKEMVKAAEDFLEKYAAATQNAQQTTQQAATAPNSFTDVNKALDYMRRTGGEVEFNGKRGLIVEIFYDYTAHKLRARTNDGQNGLMNARFPNSARIQDAVYLVPSYYVTLASKCYAVANSVPLANYRIR